MVIVILGSSIRKDDSIMRFLVAFPELAGDKGYHGVQVSLPTTLDAVKEAVRASYYKVQQNISDCDNLRTQYASILDTEITLGD